MLCKALHNKKNWLFTGSERAWQRAAAIQSLLGTAKLNGLNPMTWLKETLEKLPVWPNSRIDELLPLTPEQIDIIKHTLPARAKWYGRALTFGILPNSFKARYSGCCLE